MTTDDIREQAIEQAAKVMLNSPANSVGLLSFTDLAHALADAGLLAGTADTTEAEAECTCPWVDPKYWTTHYGAIEPGSTQEYEPTCPVHGALRERAVRAEAELAALRDGVEALADWYERQARAEDYGGELWSTTMGALRALLTDGGDPE